MRHAFVAIGLAVYTAACSSPAKSIHMVPAALALEQGHDATVSIEVAGGRDTNPAKRSQVANDEFAEALRTSVLEFGAFRGVTNAEEADYNLHVFLASLSQPAIGLTFDVSLETGWTLVRASSGEVVFQEPIVGRSQQRFGDSPIAVSRMRGATEGAAREAIRAGLERIGALNL